MSHTRDRFMRVLVVLSLLVITPLSFSPHRGVSENNVCGSDGGSCVREIGSICEKGQITEWDHYYQP